MKVVSKGATFLLSNASSYRELTLNTLQQKAETDKTFSAFCFLLLSFIHYFIFALQQKRYGRY